MKKLIALLLAGLMAVSAVGCASTPSDSSSTTSGDSTSSTTSGTEAQKSNYAGTSDPDMVTIDVRAEPPDLNPTTTNDVASADILRLTTAGLFKLDENDQPVPDLAESYKVSEDGKTYTIKLREDAKWNNGDPVTAHDFIYSWTISMTEKTASTPYHSFRA